MMTENRVKYSKMADQDLRVGFVGGGNMALAVAEGIMKSGFVQPKNITTSVLTDKSVEKWKLKDETCSPGGSTICGIHELEKGGLRGLFINAIEAACKRVSEMGK
ncbi:hypothetical protein QZH41_003793 [Actinostola sp. cb2023]|nr:hypothetical protein QZH41_003793 [Actinostola sp. cb2023]